MRSRIQLFVSFLAIAFVLLASDVYRDPQARFSAALPTGWTSGTAGGMTRFVSGNAYALIHIVEGGAADPRRVAQFTDQFGQQWRDYRRLQNGKAQLGAIPGAFAIYSGTNPKGVDAIVKAVSAPFGNDAIVILSSCPVAEWTAKKQNIESIERGFQAGQPPHQAPVQTQSNRQLPQGFSVTARSGPSGQALTASFQGGRSARAAFSGIFKSAYSYFDSPPTLQAAVSDRQDQEVQGFFRSVYQGVPVRGLMVVTTANGAVHAGLLFDREETFGRSYPTLARQMAGALPAGGGGGGGAPVARKPVQLQKQQLPDGSGWIGIAPGYRVTASYKGTVDVVGQPFISPETLLRMARKARYGYGFWTVFLAFVFGVRTKGVRNAAKMGTPPACYCLRFTAKPNTRSGCSEQMRKLHSQSARYALGTANGIPSSAAFRISSLICRWRYFSSNSLTPRSTQAWPCVSSR